MKKLMFATAVAALFATGALAQDREFHGDRDRDRGADVPGAIIGGTVRALEGRSVERDGDCRLIIERRRAADGDIVEERHRECD